MLCDPQTTNNTLPPALKILKEIGDTMIRYRKQCASTFSPLRKLVLGELILNSTKLSRVDIQAKEIEAATFIERLEATLTSYKADIDRIPVNVLQDLARAVGMSEQFVQEWAPKQKRKVEDHYAYVLKALTNMKRAFEVGKRDWPALRDSIVEKHGVEALRKDAK